MTNKTIRKIADAWKVEKRPYVKQSTFATYMLILENHILPSFGESCELSENVFRHSSWKSWMPD